MRTPQVDAAIKLSRYPDAGTVVKTLATEVERLEAEHIEAMAAITAASRAAGQERTRAETAEPLLKQTEAIAAQRMQSCATLLARAEAAEARVKELEAWKASALAVEKEWDAQEVGKLLGLTLGTRIRAGIAPAIKNLQAQNAKLRAALERLEYLARNNRTTRMDLRDGLQAALNGEEAST